MFKSIEHDDDDVIEHKGDDELKNDDQKLSGEEKETKSGDVTLEKTDAGE